MKYLITDLDSVSVDNVNSFLRAELLKTSLRKEEIKIESTLKTKIAMAELKRIFSENGMEDKVIFDRGFAHLKESGNTIEFSVSEISSRFQDSYDSILEGLISYYKVFLNAAEENFKKVWQSL